MAFDRSYFETQYASYEHQNPPRKMAFYRRLAEAAAADCANPRILDIGCAFGFFLSTLGSRWERFGIDASEYAITRARERVPDARFAVTTSSELVFSAPFDVITAFDVLEHIPAPDEVLARIAAALRPRAGFVFVVPVYDGLTGPAIRHLDRDPTHLHKREGFMARNGRRSFSNCRLVGDLQVPAAGRLLLPPGDKILQATDPGDRMSCPTSVEAV
jgi:SAM-dependent methyltransferase